MMIVYGSMGFIKRPRPSADPYEPKLPAQARTLIFTISNKIMLCWSFLSKNEDQAYAKPKIRLNVGIKLLFAK